MNFNQGDLSGEREFAVVVEHCAALALAGSRINVTETFGLFHR